MSDSSRIDVGLSAGVYLGSALLVGLTSSNPNIQATSSCPVDSLSMVSILAANLTLAAVLIAGGFVLGVPTIIALAVNGALLGSIASGLSAQPSLLIAGTVPHGIFELAALIVAGAMGIRFTRLEINLIVGKEDSIRFTHLVVAGSIVILLLTIAAFVEVSITPDVLSAFGSNCD